MSFDRTKTRASIRKKTGAILILLWAGSLLGSLLILAESDSEKKIWVQKPDGVLQCDRKRSSPSARKTQLSQVVKELRAAGVVVFESGLGRDGLVRAQVCGSPAGGVLRALIAERQLDQTLSFGFKPEK